jgi:hypothetical protein
MNDLYRTLRNRRPPMVVKIQRKRHVTGPMAQPQKADGERAPDAQA